MGGHKRAGESQHTREGAGFLGGDTTRHDDEGAHVGCQSGLRPRDTPLGLILFLVPTLLPIP